MILGLALEMFNCQKSIKSRIKGNRNCQVLANLLAAKVGVIFYLRRLLVLPRLVVIFLAEFTALIMVFVALLAAPIIILLACLALRVIFFLLKFFLKAFERSLNILIKANFYFHITPANSLYWGGLKGSSYALLFGSR